MDPTTGIEAFADQHPRLRDLCTLPGGTVIAKTTAVARGYILRGAVPASTPRPSPALVKVVPHRPVAPPVTAAVAADRARALALIDMTAPGAEAQAECAVAIRAGTLPRDYASTVAARLILDAMADSAQGRR